MIHNGVFREARTDDRMFIAIEVDTARAQKIFANDESIKQFIARQFGRVGDSFNRPRDQACGSITCSPEVPTVSGKENPLVRRKEGQPWQRTTGFQKPLRAAFA